jgi:dienelactone hydrolase
MSISFLRALAILSCIGASATAAAQSAAESTRCHVGFYRLKNSSGVDIGPADDGALRWRLRDGTSGALTLGADHKWHGTSGWTGRSDNRRVSFGDCAAETIEFDGVPGRRMHFDTHDVSFQSADVTLAGRLVMPEGAGAVPVVVLVHGSEQSSAREFFSLQRQFPGEGIGAFVYDKRGTGDSNGTYTHDYGMLAGDAAAAVREARRLAGARAGRVGFQGSSQGGWVAPLAATMTPVDFVIVAYGLAVSPLDEDREAVALDMSRHGFSPDETRKALEVAAAGHAIIYGGFQSGYEEFDALRARYEHEPWFRYLRGNVTQILLSMPHETLRVQGPILFAGIQPDYDPLPVLRRLTTPQLWILGAEDIDAPVGETLRRLRALKERGRPIDALVYPHAEHGMYEFETGPDGERVSVRLPATYLPLMCDFARRGRIGRRYGDATVY